MLRVVFWFCVTMILCTAIIMAKSLSISYKQESEWDESGLTNQQHKLERIAAALSILGIAGIIALGVFHGF